MDKGCCQARRGLDFPDFQAGEFYLTTSASLLWCVQVGEANYDDTRMNCYFDVTQCLFLHRPALECIHWECDAGSRGWMKVEPNKAILDKLFESLGGNIFETVTKAMEQLKRKIDDIDKETT